ncbi:Rv3235 family protein [Actinosynnema sp. CS-041913]|uniref:Rv3235 family protein n=1 Tax=Actinosynnema sp. CS-041913 TaxID=3239917 RepID=UPI003D8BBF73
MSSPTRTLRARKPAADRRTTTLHHLLTAVVEAVDGRRPLHQLTGILTPPAAAEVGKARSPGQGGRLDGVRLCRVSPEVTELAGVVVTHQGRVRALAARLEWTGDRWRCTEFHLLP